MIGNEQIDIVFADGIVDYFNIVRIEDCAEAFLPQNLLNFSPILLAGVGNRHFNIC